MNLEQEKLVIFTRYSDLGASSRCRYYLYRPMLEGVGLTVKIKTFFSNKYLQKLYKTGRKSHFGYLQALLRRYWALLFLGDARKLLIEYELLPFLPYSFEYFFLKNRRYIVNYDDNVWDKYRKNPLLRHKFNALVRRASGVIVANDFLLEKVSKMNANTVKIPTVVNLQDYQTPVKKCERFTIVWIGTPVTYEYLKNAAPVLQAMAQRFDFDLLVIASEKLAEQPIENVNMRFVNWSAATEVGLLKSAHVGFMPLTYDSFSRGKSAYKIIQYMAAGLPVIASDIGENSVVIKPGETGFLCTNGGDYLEALNQLINNRKIYNAMHNAALERAQQFSLDYYQGPFLNFLWQRLFKEPEKTPVEE